MKLIALAIGFMLAVISPAYAGPGFAPARREAQKIKQAERKLAKRIAKLSESDRKRLKSEFSSTDSDGDGVSDIIEGAIGSNRCDADSDDDGFDDSNDYDEDTPGADDDEPGSGDDDSGRVEFEAKGEIVSFDDPSLVIGNRTYTLTQATQFIGTGFTKEDLQAGLCVEVKGLRDDSQREVTRIKRDDDC
jgi:hypothetical protein